MLLTLAYANAVAPFAKLVCRPGLLQHNVRARAPPSFVMTNLCCLGNR